MTKNNHKSSVFLMAAIALLAWIALGIQLNLLLEYGEQSGLTVGGTLARYFGYFTILTNLLAALNLTIILAFPVSALAQSLSRPSVQAAITVYLVFVALGYNLLLRSLWEPTGLQRLADELLHVIIPILFLIYWLISVLKGKLKFLHLIPWLAYPLLYLILALMRGTVDQFYPYPFLDVNKLGYTEVLWNSGMLALCILAIGFIIIIIDKLLYRRNQRAVIT